MPPLKTKIDTWIFDLDNTLYSADSGIFQQVGELMSMFVSNHLNIDLKEAKKIINEKYIVGGMKPKINTCINAIDQGVKQATILDGRIPHALILELFTEHGIGTQIYT